MFKEMLEIASQVTENTNPQLSIVFDAFGVVMADNYAEVLRKGYGIYKKYKGLTMQNAWRNYGGVIHEGQD